MEHERIKRISAEEETKFFYMSESNQMDYVETHYPYWASHEFHLNTTGLQRRWQDMFLIDHSGIRTSRRPYEDSHTFAVGSQVRVRKELIQQDVSNNMKHWLNKIVTIESVVRGKYNGEIRYIMRDCPRWFWEERQLEKIVEQKKSQPLPLI